MSLALLAYLFSFTDLSALKERVRILELLLVSLEPEHVVQESWLKLAEQRRDEVRTGKVTMVPGDEALSRVRKRLT